MSQVSIEFGIRGHSNTIGGLVQQVWIALDMHFMQSKIILQTL